MPQQTETRTVIVDLERCMACRSCETACAKAHAGYEDIVEAILADAHMVPRVKVIAAAGVAVPIQCQHCEDAPCATVCPSGALSFDEETGEVRSEPARCIGCKACVIVCPFGAVEWSRRTGEIVRCDLCEDLIEEGEEPYCVRACPTGARQVIDLDALAQRKRQEAAQRTVLVMTAKP
ncbi:MAG: 4Fe-4S dicluster domain-containing protein [Planctomycetes bacterium]|nr:4Fe-4S dicluster domain-containing protein [Planctomycetota bacterium]